MLLDVDRYGLFVLDRQFLDGFRNRPVSWGFGDLSWSTYMRTYSRDGEVWWQTCRRVVEGYFTVQRIHCLDQGIPWDRARADQSARESYARLFSFKWTPPGRGLWIMGTRFIFERGGAALNNCGFVSTRDLDLDFSSPFVWMFRMSMLGVGVGFDTRGRGKLDLRAPARGEDCHSIEDSREGWMTALKRLLDAFAGKGSLPAAWDYSRIRPSGAVLSGFGGRASGPDPLRQMLDALTTLCGGQVGKKADSTLIVDIMNLIGRCVVAGGIRRSAQIAFGDADDELFLNLKQDHAAVMSHRWASNNSIFATDGMDYEDAAGRTRINGEPGYFWLDHARAFGRMKDPPDWRDAEAAGSNPCVEQTLWDRELCCLVETYPAHHESWEDYKETLRIAYQYAKTVTLVPVEDFRSQAVMARNRRIGCSMTGIVQAIGKLGYKTFFEWCQKGYDWIQDLDREFSDRLGVPRSIKTTSVKPSGTVSLLAGATPGVHWGYSPFYLRRIRVTADHPLADMCRKAGYAVEPDAYTSNTAVIAFPVRIAAQERTGDSVSVREKVDLAAQMQRYWSDNQVSCTATFDPETEGDDIGRILPAYEDRLKAISFLPLRRHGYAQPPYEEITREEYGLLMSRLKPLQGGFPHEEESEARFCEGEECQQEKEPLFTGPTGSNPASGSRDVR
jgi:ribonucleoside-triphosphate reductase